VAWFTVAAILFVYCPQHALLVSLPQYAPATPPDVKAASALLLSRRRQLGKCRPLHPSEKLGRYQLFVSGRWLASLGHPAIAKSFTMRPSDMGALKLNWRLLVSWLLGSNTKKHLMLQYIEWSLLDLYVDCAAQQVSPITKFLDRAAFQSDYKFLGKSYSSQH